MKVFLTDAHKMFQKCSRLFPQIISGAKLRGHGPFWPKVKILKKISEPNLGVPKASRSQIWGVEGTSEPNMGVPKAPSEPNLGCRRYVGAKFQSAESKAL